MNRLFRFLSEKFIHVMAAILHWWDGESVPTASLQDVELANASDDSPPTIILDVRSASEVCVSRIPGAVTLEEFRELDADSQDKPVIVYCTVGGRSLLYARQLRRRGIDARNYQDGILGWCDAGKTVVDPEAQLTQRVHTHNFLFTVPDPYQTVTGRIKDK